MPRKLTNVCRVLVVTGNKATDKDKSKFGASRMQLVMGAVLDCGRRTTICFCGPAKRQVPKHWVRSAQGILWQ